MKSRLGSGDSWGNWLQGRCSVEHASALLVDPGSAVEGIREARQMVAQQTLDGLARHSSRVPSIGATSWALEGPRRVAG